jgi:hypothetical protein
MAKRVNFEEKHLSRSIMIMVLWAGIVGIAFQLNESVKDLAIFTGMVTFFSLVISSRKFDERELQLLSQAYSITFQWLAVILLVIYIFLQISARANFAGGIALFLNAHWIGITVSVICAILGGAGILLFKEYK